MRIALAAIFQLTNTFSRQSTGIDSFADFNAEQPGALPACDTYGTQRFASALAEAANERGIVVERCAHLVARAAGPIRTEDFASLTDRLSTSVQSLPGKIDAVVLLLSGAMTSRDGNSIDLALIEATRRSIGAQTPIVSVFSQWANLNDEIVRSADLVMGVDLTNEADAVRKADLLARSIATLADGSVRPIVELRNVRILTPTGSSSASEALETAKAMALEFGGQSGVVDVSVFQGFAFADVSHAGLSVAVTTNGDQALATSLSERLQRSIWDRRESFTWSPPNVEIAVHDAMLSSSGPVIIAEVGDDPMFGAAGDGTGLLWALIDLGALDVALGVIVDPEGVSSAIESGVGSMLKMDIGGSLDRRAGYPINVTARVRRIVDGLRVAPDRCRLDEGRAVLLEVQGRHGGQIDVIVTERAPTEVNAELFTALGVDLSVKKIVAVKRSFGGRAAFGSKSAEFIVTTTPGITTPLFHYFDWTRIPRPIHPLDAI